VSARRIVGTMCLIVVSVAFGLSRCCNAEEAPKGPAIRPGDKVRVVNGPAPLKDGAKTVVTVETGTEFEAIKVQGDWVQVKVATENGARNAWIKASEHLEAVIPERAAEVQPAPKKQEPQPEGPKKTQDRGELPPKTQTVDIVTFIKAVAAGEEGRYKGYLVEGGGACSSVVGGEKSPYALVLVCAKRPDGSFYKIKKSFDGKGKTPDRYNFDARRDRIFSVQLVFEGGRMPKGFGATVFSLLGKSIDRFTGRFQGNCSEAGLSEGGGQQQKVRVPVLVWEESAR